MMMMMFEMVGEQEQEKKVPDGTKTYSSIKELENRFDNSQEKQCYSSHNPYSCVIYDTGDVSLYPRQMQTKLL